MAKCVLGKRALANDAGPVIAFYGHKVGKQYCEFSNFYWHRQPYEFTLPSYASREGFPTSISCSFSEKAIMATKAALMDDLETFHEIVAADNPAQCKGLGRKVRNFNDDLWTSHLEDTAYEVVRQKFVADSRLSALLLSTGRAILAEAAPTDAIWGIGLPTSDPRVQDPEQWCGRNILGYALMQVREHLRHSGDAGGSAAVAGYSTGSRGAEASVNASDELSVTIQDYVDTGTRKAGRRWGKAPAKDATPLVATASSTHNASDPSYSSHAGVDSASSSTADGLFDCFAVLDFEATCEDGTQIQPQEIIEFPIVLVHHTGKTLGEFRTYVRPVHHPTLTAFCTQLTGIEQATVDAAVSWPEALTQAQLWLDARQQEFGYNRCIFVTCGDWDLATMMVRQCKVSSDHIPERFQRWLNIKNLFKSVKGRSGGGMKQMLDELGLKLEGRHHSGLDDCRNIGRILVDLFRRGLEVELSMVSSRTSSGKKGAGEGAKQSRK